MHAENGDHPIVLFDGVCTFCGRTVHWILKRDRKARFRFAPLQSEVGRELLQRHDLASDLATMILIDRGRAHTKSSGALRIARRLRFPWLLLAVLLVIPKPVRDFLYDQFAKRRYAWFGREEVCFVPERAIRDRFLG